jgi:hypothetical protein
LTAAGKNQKAMQTGGRELSAARFPPFGAGFRIFGQMTKSASKNAPI